MFEFIIKRILWLFPVLFIITLLTFTLTNLSAGEPAAIAVRQESGGKVTEEAVVAMRAKMGLDESLPRQYLRWINGVLRLDLGTSYKTKNPVIQEIASKFPATMMLTFCSMFVMLSVSLVIGIASARYPNSLIDRFGKLLSFATVSVPPFLLGLGLLYFFGVYLKWIPIIGDGSSKYVWLPAITTGVSHCGAFIVLVRTNMTEVLGRGYMKAARARGLSEGTVMTRHALRNAILPVLTKSGVVFASMLGGSSIIEAIFSWPGIGQLALESIYNKDIPVLQGFMLMSATLIIVINLIVDIAYKMIDRKIKIA